MKARTVFIAVIVTVLFVNCQSEGNSHSGSEAKNTGNAAAALPGGAEQVNFTTSDGIVITGTLYPAGSKAPTVLCLHQWRSDRGSFAALAKKLQGAGMTVLAIDMRGYGGSTRTADGKSIRPDRRAGPDIEAAMKFLRANPAVDAAHIGIIGASYGSSNAIIYAAGDPAVRAVVLLSPGLNYFNELPTEGAVRKFGGRPLLAVASSEDLRSVETVDAYRAAVPSIQTKLYENAGHGTDILDAGVGLDAVISDFLKKNL
ncbi:MAG: alpha/beta fold hydrolase [Bacteroidetes bacterium]|nr:alpha/beta fold hydrolase [Bacteroidota bacterium]